MKMSIEELTIIAKEQCDSVARVLERHAKDTKAKEKMDYYKALSHGRLNAIVETTINIYACELDDNAYWEKVKDLRSYEDKIETKLKEISSKWYSEYLKRI